MTADYEAFRFNTMVAKLMELSNTLFRYRGTPVAGDAAWDEAIRLLLLMLAPAAPHITEELWSRRAGRRPAATWSSIHTEIVAEVDESRDRRGHARGPGPGQRQAARQAVVVAADADQRRPSWRRPRWPARKVAALLAGRQPDRIIQAGGGKLMNIVLREG